MQTHILDADGFKLAISLEIFEKDIRYPVNTIMTVSVTSDSFSASCTMEIDIKQFALFSKDLRDVYADLRGSAKIEEPYGYHKFIEFTSSNTGHIGVKGYLCDDLRDNEFFFSNGFDQTFLRSFADELASAYLKYCE